jgi:hypothetical protein
MAYTDQELATLAAAVAGLPTAAHNLLASKSPEESLEAIGLLIAKTRAQTASDAVKTLVSLTVSNWTALTSVDSAFPVGTILEDLKAAALAFDANDAANLGPRLMTLFMSARKHFGI